MIGVIDYYGDAPKNYREATPTGLICRVPIPFTLMPCADRLLLTRFDVKDPKSAEFSLKRTDLTSYKPTEDPPLRHLTLKSDEFLLSIGYKFRYCIIISEPINNISFKSPGEQGFIVVPLYGTRKEDGTYKDYIDYEMVLRAQAYQLANTFYLPESNDYLIRESFARLDRMCFINAELIVPRPVTLTIRALELLREWTWKCFGFPLEGLDPSLDKYIEEAAKRINERLKIQ